MYALLLLRGKNNTKHRSFSVLLLSHIFDPEFEALIAHCFKYYVESGCIEKMEFVSQRGIFANKDAALSLPLLTREG